MSVTSIEWADYSFNPCGDARKYRPDAYTAMRRPLITDGEVIIGVLLCLGGSCPKKTGKRLLAGIRRRERAAAASEFFVAACAIFLKTGQSYRSSGAAFFR